jgi:hypothetical protein
MSGRFAGAVGLVKWLTLGAVVDGRYDRHSGDGGSVIDGGISLRASYGVGDLRLGAEIKGWVPGSESASTTFKATSADARLLAGSRFGSGLVAVIGGYRLDRGPEAGKTAARLALGDRATLGLSDFDAVLLGLGGAVSLGSAELMLEATADLLVGKGAPAIGESPLRATGGVRLPLTKRLAAELTTTVSLSKRPEVSPAAPLVPIEPRLLALAGLRYRFSASEPPPPIRVDKPPPVAPPAPKTPEPPKDSPFEVVVTDEEGAPLPDAKVTLTVEGRPRELPGDGTGRYREEHVPPGPAELSIEAPGYEPIKRDIGVERGVAVNLPVKLVAVPPPSQVRGVVRTFAGEPLSARIRVEPGGLEVSTDATGAFQIDVPPGKYEVTIEASGYQVQRRSVEVLDQGVVILNADLVKKKR